MSTPRTLLPFERRVWHGVRHEESISGGVGRYVADGTLTGQHPICGSRESKRHKVIISLDEVRTLAAARRVVKGDA
jgi:hypothetical protein